MSRNERLAHYNVHEQFEVDTTDNEDHTFNGIYFEVECETREPVDALIISKVWVRGALGDMTVFTSDHSVSLISEYEEVDCDSEEEGNTGSGSSDSRDRRGPPRKKRITKRRRRQRRQYHHNYNLLPECVTQPEKWNLHFDSHIDGDYTYDPNKPKKFHALDLNPPVTIRPGRRKSFYIHSASPSDDGIVYDNFLKNGSEYDDGITYGGKYINIYSAIAHLQSVPFSARPRWAGNPPFRLDRAFVGRLTYGVRFLLWNPWNHQLFSNEFRRTVKTLLLCQRRSESNLSWFGDDILFYIINFFGHKWFITNEQIAYEKQIEEERKEKYKSKPNIMPMNINFAGIPLQGGRNLRQILYYAMQAGWFQDDDDDDDDEANEENEEENDSDYRPLEDAQGGTDEEGGDTTNQEIGEEAEGEQYNNLHQDENEEHV